jgi:Flp pilus assembly protein TadD
MGWCELKRGNVAHAVALLERAAQLAPREAVILHHLADAYARLGRRAEAVAQWTRALLLLERDPEPRVRAAVEEAIRRIGGRAARDRRP